MRRSLWLMAALLVLSSVGAQRSEAQIARPHLLLHRGTINARAPLGTPSRLLVAAPGGYTVVQFDGPITTERRAALLRTGVSILEYLPEFAYLVRGDGSQLATAAQIPGVYATAPFALADKLAPSLLQALQSPGGWSGPVRIVAWAGQEGAMERALRASSFQQDAQADSARLLRIAALPEVRWVEPAGQPRLLNDVARDIMNVDEAQERTGIYGAGQIVAVADSGLDTGDIATLSPDFAPGRIVATHVLSAGGDLADTNGHGTHVAGSIAGGGVQSGANPAAHSYAGSFAGVAPEAGLVVQAFEATALGEIIGLSADYYGLYEQAYADGARLFSNSWGDTTGPASDPEAEFGGYPFGAQRTDQFVWEHQDAALFFAAGNAGADGVPGVLDLCRGDGVVDADSLMTPGTAKNTITVGASESLRATGGISQLPWVLVSFCFANQPIATDLTSNNANGMAAFSSRGPTDDGRMKPDLVAPGTNIVSNHSHAEGAGALWGLHETNTNYAYSGGTSMATPLAAGAGALVREWLTLRGNPNPSAAAVKAALLNTTADIAPGQYGTGATQEIPNARPNGVAGWGRADMSFMAAPAPYLLWVDDHTAGLATNDTVAYTGTKTQPLEVLSSEQPLRVMLAWTDPPASLSAAAQLVNDLDLVLIGPDGQRYRGNNAATADRTNNVEGIVVPNPPLGGYRIEITGFNVPIGEQPYALAVAGALNDAGQMFLSKSANTTSVAPGGLITYTLKLRAGNRALAAPVTLTDTLPLNSSFVGASEGRQVEQVVEWTVPALAANASVTRTLVVRVNADVPLGTTIVNADYRAENGVDLPAQGAPVAVPVRSSAPPSPAGIQRLWLPALMRQ